MPRGWRQACWAVRLIRSPTPKPTSSPTLRSVWEKWEMILLFQPGRAKVMVLGNQSLQGSESNRRHEKPTVWTRMVTWWWGLHRWPWRKFYWGNSAATVSAIVRSSENKDCAVKHKQLLEATSAQRPMAQPDAPTWKLLGPQGTASFCEKNGGTVASTKM